MKSVALNAVILSLIACLAIAQGSPSETSSASEPAKKTAPREKRKKASRDDAPQVSNAVNSREEGTKDKGTENDVKDVFPRFSILGDWTLTHPLWTDVATFHPDGSVTTARQGTTGRWFLAGDGGTPLVVIRWELFGTESVGMVNLDHFRGQTRSGRFIDMRRKGAPSE